MSEKEIQRIFEEEPVPQHILDKMEEYLRKGREIPDLSLIKRPSHIEGIRRAGVINTGVLD